MNWKEIEYQLQLIELQLKNIQLKKYLLIIMLSRHSIPQRVAISKVIYYVFLESSINA